MGKSLLVERDSWSDCCTTVEGRRRAYGISFPTTIALLLTGCAPDPVAPPEAPDRGETIQLGGLYAGRTEAGHYLIYKVLALDDKAAFLREYSNEFPDVPSAAELSALEINGDLAIARDFFFENSPRLITVEAVTPEEAASYQRYRGQVGR